MAKTKHGLEGSREVASRNNHNHNENQSQSQSNEREFTNGKRMVKSEVEVENHKPITKKKEVKLKEAQNNGDEPGRKLKSKIKEKRDERRENTKYEKSKHSSKKFQKRKPKLTTEDVLNQLSLSFSRDATWFKNTLDKIEEVKANLDKKFYSEEKRQEKIDFIRKLKAKIKDYKDALQFADRYKKVKFVERRKLERMLTKANKQLDSCTDSDARPKLEKERQEIVDNINYVKYFPKTYKYLSLFPKNDQENLETQYKIGKIRSKIKMHLDKKEKIKGEIQRNQDEHNNGQVVVDYEKERSFSKGDQKGKGGEKEEEDDFFIYDEN